jgi:hypothetical protein
MTAEAAASQNLSDDSQEWKIIYLHRISHILRDEPSVEIQQNGAKERVLDVCVRLFGGSSGTVCSTC